MIKKNPKWEYAGVYADYGITGTSISKREEFQRMIMDCEKGKIDVILTKSISRFARNTVDLLNTVRYLKSLGIEVWFEKEQIHSCSKFYFRHKSNFPLKRFSSFKTFPANNVPKVG